MKSETVLPFRHLVELGREATLVIQDGQCVYANAAAARLLGAEHAGELLGRFEQELAKPVAGEQIGPITTCWTKQDGTRRSVEVSTYALEWEGRPALALFVQQGLSEARMQTLEDAKQYAESIFETLHEPLLVLTPELRVKSANAAFYACFGVTPEETLDRRIYELGNGQWNIAALRILLEEVLPENRLFQNFEVSHRFETLGDRVMLLSGSKLDDLELILLGIQDITERRRTETRLRTSEARYRELFDSMLEGFCIIELVFDAAGKPVDYVFLETNAAFEQQTGLHDAAGSSVRALVPNLEPEWFEFYGAVALTGEPVRFVNEVKDLNRWFDIYAYRIGGGESRQVAVMFSDITDYKRAADTARQGEATLNAVLDTLPAAVVIADAQGKIIRDNAANRELWGIPPETASWEGYENWVGWWPDTGKRIEAHEWAMTRALLHGRVTRDELIENRRFGSGEHRFYINNVAPLRNPEGKIIGGVAAMLDVTDRLAAERALRQSEARLRGILEQLPVGVCLTDRDGRFVLSNFIIRRYALWHEQAADRAREDAGLLLSPDTWPIARALRGESVHAGAELSCTDEEGRERWLLVSAVPFETPDEGLSGAIAVAQDITELKAAEAALREADRRKDDFLATLAHELRNPLVPIVNAMTILEMQGTPSPLMGQVRDMIEPQVRHMVRMIDDLLDVGRITRGKMTIRRERVKLADILRHSLDTVRPDRHHALSVSLPAEEIDLNADPVRLAQVFSNLLSNACKYTEKGGRISLTAHREGRLVTVTVKDSGQGVAASDLPRLFDMFWQASTHEGRADRGLGLGLALSRAFVHMHGGTIEARSEGIGKGTEFLVRLPVVARKPSAAGANKDDARHGMPPARRVLVVDDNPAVASSLASLLRVYGSEVQIAQDGVEAVAMAESVKPDLILLDIGLPRMDGYDACRAIRRTPWGQSVRIIALSGWGQREDLRKSEEAGFDGHLVKPAEASALRALLESSDPLRG